MVEEEEIIGAAAHQFASEILVELMCRDDDDDLVVYSYAFAYSGEETVQPKEPVPTDHREPVTATLTEKGFSLNASTKA
jgi:hypothetical protein